MDIPVEEHLGCFQSLAIRHAATQNILVRVFGEHKFSLLG